MSGERYWHAFSPRWLSSLLKSLLALHHSFGGRHGGAEQIVELTAKPEVIGGHTAMQLYKSPDDTWVGSSPIRKEIAGLAKHYSTNITKAKEMVAGHGEDWTLAKIRKHFCGRNNTERMKEDSMLPECGSSDRRMIRLAESYEWPGWDGIAHTYNTGQDGACDYSCNMSQIDNEKARPVFSGSHWKCEHARAICAYATGVPTSPKPSQRVEGAGWRHTATATVMT